MRQKTQEMSVKKYESGRGTFKKVSLAFAFMFIAAASQTFAQSSVLRSSIENGEAKFAKLFTSGDSAGVSNLYSEDAELLPPNGAIVKGRRNIQSFWQGAWDAGMKKIEVRTVETDGDGKVAYEVGRYTLYGDAGNVLDEGKYVVIWKKSGETWFLYRDIWNSNKK